MTTSSHDALALEWATLQNNYETYEKGGIALKIASVVMYLALAGDPGAMAELAVGMLSLWMVEGMYRTYQARLGERLLRVESALRLSSATHGYQLHSEWLATRPGAAGLLAEYARNAMRPGVAFPHALLFMLAAFMPGL